MLLAEWSAGWGRLGTNLLAFMGGLYILRGAAVLLVLWGGVSSERASCSPSQFCWAGPFVALGAMLIGVGDSWLDLRVAGDTEDRGERVRGGRVPRGRRAVRRVG